MNKTNLSKMLGAAVVAGLLATQVLAVRAHAAGAAEPGTPAPAARKATAHPYPFRGTIDAVDAAGRTLQLGGKKGDRTLHITGESVLERDGKPLKFEEILRGDYAKGLVTRPDGSREIVVKASFGGRPGGKTRRHDNAANR